PARLGGRARAGALPDAAVLLLRRPLPQGARAPPAAPVPGQLRRAADAGADPALAAGAPAAAPDLVRDERPLRARARAPDPPRPRGAAHAAQRRPALRGAAAAGRDAGAERAQAALHAGGARDGA